ncbi:MAG: type II toxin-antitoxin system RelE/ParE family toxin [Nannocystaceae bacterium]
MTALFSLPFHPDAVDELDAAVDWYERHTTGAGARLLAEIIEVVGVLHEFPRSGAPVSGFDAGFDVRLSPLRHYPFLIVTARVADRRFVVAVAHARREPRYWRRRLR